MALDAYNEEDLTQAHLASDLTAQTYRAIQTDGMTITSLSSLAIFARDNAGLVSTGALGAEVDGNVTLNPLITIEDGFNIGPVRIADGDEEAPSRVVTAKDRKIFERFVAKAEVDDGVVKLTATASGRVFLAPIDAAGPVPAVVDDPLTDVDETAAAKEAVPPMPGSQGA